MKKISLVLVILITVFIIFSTFTAHGATRKQPVAADVKNIKGTTAIPEIKRETRVSPDLIPVGMVIPFARSQTEDQYLQYGTIKGTIKVRVYSYNHDYSAGKLALVFYSPDNKILKVLNYKVTSHDAVDMILDTDNQTLVIRGHYELSTIIPLSTIESALNSALNETEPNEPEISYESRDSVNVPSACVMGYGNSKQVPYLKYGEIKARAFFCKGNNACLLEVYSKDNRIIKTIQSGWDNIEDMYVDEIQKEIVTVSAYGEAGTKYIDLAPFAFPSKILSESRSSVKLEVPDGLKESSWQTTERPYFRYGFLRARLFSYIDDRNSSLLVIYDQYGKVLHDLTDGHELKLEVKGKNATEMHINDSDKTLVFTFQDGKTASVPLSNITKYHDSAY